MQVSGCYNFDSDHSLDIKIEFGNYPNLPSTITISDAACLAVLNYVSVHIMIPDAISGASSTDFPNRIR